MKQTVHLGFEFGTGKAVEIPLAHTFVTGQTQLSGKTTTLRAIVERSGRRALAFVTKRGETFDGRRIRPYLPREGAKQLPWRLVEAIMAASLGQRNMKWERAAIVTATKGATTLEQVRTNVGALHDKTKNPKNQELYMLLGEYLDLVLPEMKALRASHELQLGPGLNVMDLSGIGTQTQAMVIRAALEQINQHEEEVLTVFPEAWEFAPRGRAAPAKDEAIAMARKGAVLGNFLLCDSQDIAGVETVVRQAASVWILGVQRELNELKRTLQMIPAGIKKPKAEDVSTLELGQFWACWGRHAVKVYVQPAWMSAADAIHVAGGGMRPVPPARRNQEDEVNAAEATAIREDNKHLQRENDRLRGENEDLRRRLERLEAAADEPSRAARAAVAPVRDDRSGDRAPAAAQQAAPRADSAARSDAGDVDVVYPQLLSRLVADAAKDPVLLKLIATKPELEVTLRRVALEATTETLRGRLALLITEGFFDAVIGGTSAFNELQRRGIGSAKPNVYRELDRLVTDGFLTKESGGFLKVPGMRITVREVA